MKILCMKFAVKFLRVLYTPFKLLKQKNRVLIVSRQSDKPTLDIDFINREIESRGTECKVLTKVLKKNLISALFYGFHMIKQMYYIATSRVIVLDGYCILVSILPKKKNHRVIQIWHALGAVKKFGWQSVGKSDGSEFAVSEVMGMHKNYDFAIAPSKVTSKIFSEAFELGEENIKLLGLPRIDYLLDDSGYVSIIKDMYSKYPILADEGKVNVLYAPTFRKGSSVDVENIISNFNYDKYNLIVKKHWLDNSDYSVYNDTYSGLIVDSSYEGLDWLKVCDKVVTDYSAIIFEAAVLERDIYLYTPDKDIYKDRTGLNMDFSKEPIAEYTFEDISGLCEALEKDYNKDRVVDFKNKYIQIVGGNCTNDLVDFVLE